MLGELNHNYGNVYEIKTQIVKYLHQQLGFNTIASESGTYELYKAEEDIKTNNKDVKIAFQNSIFAIWSQSKEFESFTDFYKQHKNNIKLFGFDCQQTGSYSDETLVSDLYQYCKRHSFKFPLDQEDVSLLIESIHTSSIYDTHDIPYKKFISTLKNLIKQINKIQVSEEHFYWKIIIQNLLKNASNLNPKYNTLKVIKASGDEYIKEYLEVFKRNRNQLTELAQEKFTTDYADNPRDEIMGENLLAYIKKHSNEKIIYWGANAHFVNNMTSVDFPIIKGFKPMGSYIKNSLKEKVYSLALVTAEIKFNRKYFKQQNRLFSPITYVPSRLDKIHDGYLYFNKATPLTYLDERDQYEEKEIIKTQTIKTITGKFIDKDTRETIPFVQVLLEGTTKGTMADTKGKYELKYTSSKQKVIISAMGYAEKIFTISELPKNIYLKEESTALDEIILLS